MKYRVNEVFYTLQGEGFWTGRPAVFVRFADCNLWTGDESDRPTAICKFCDTDFTAATEYKLEELLSLIESHWPADDAGRMVVLTGGEPALQIGCQSDWPGGELPARLKDRGWYTAIETNGTLRLVRDYFNWVCVSPKTRRLQVDSGDELKFVYPQKSLTPDMFAHMNFDHYWLSPMDGPGLKSNTGAAVKYVLGHPRWRLNIQTHKVVGIP